MIDKGRLEELIEQGATIYEVKYNNINPVSLTNKIRDVYYKNGVIAFEPRPDEKYLHYKYFKNLFETKEEAEWHREFGHIERIERLELPTWEELFKEDRLLDCYTQEFGIVKNRSFIGVVLLGVDFTNEIVEVSIGSDQIFCELLTKENYTLACRKAKELFLGKQEVNG